MQTFYGQIFMHVIIHVFIYALVIFCNSLKVITIDRNMSELGQIVSINIILTLRHLFVLLHYKTFIKFIFKK
jgi:hypothetical protein